MKRIVGPLLLGTATLFPTLSPAGEPGTLGTRNAAPAEHPGALFLQNATSETLIAKARVALRSMGDYRARLVKTERIKGDVRPAQTIEVLVCHAPHAVRLEFVAGPKTGRKVLWRQDRRPSEILVREGGLLGLTSLWLNASGGLARGDTNHAVSEIGFAHILDVLERDLATLKAHGGPIRKNLGRDSRGLYQIEWEAPAGASGLYARRTLIGFDVNLFLPVDVQVFDHQGFLERYEYKNLRSRQPCNPSDLDSL